MIPEGKAVLFFSDTSTTNGATASGTIDTLGYQSGLFALEVPTSNSTSNTLTVCKIEDCDTSNGTFNAIVSLTGGTATTTSVGFVIPAAITSGGPQKYVFAVDLRGRKRFLKLTASPTTTQILGARGFLLHGEANPVTTATNDNVAVVHGY